VFGHATCSRIWPGETRASVRAASLMASTTAKLTRGVPRRDQWRLAAGNDGKETAPQADRMIAAVNTYRGGLQCRYLWRRG
jgi:hypothetical protein